MGTILKELHIVLSEAEINSIDDIEMRIHVHSEKDPDNTDGVTYIITYPKDNKEEESK